MLENAHPDLEAEIKIIKTKGDKILHKPIHKVGDKGVFVKEIEKALLDGTIDLAIHSMKDMPGEMTPGLTFVDPPKGEDPRDCFVGEPITGLIKLENAVVGTGSLRREMQLKHLLPNITTKPIRGNIETRIKKIETENLDGIILAKAGLIRAGYTQKAGYTFSVEEIIPAPCQGILALQIREDDERMKELLAPFADRETTLRYETERAFQQELNAGCHSPMGVYAIIDEENVRIKGCFGDVDRELFVKKEIAGPLAERVNLAKQLARELREAVNE